MTVPLNLFKEGNLVVVCDKNLKIAKSIITGEKSRALNIPSLSQK